MTDRCGPDLFYICGKCKAERSPQHPFNRDADNLVGRKHCHWCGSNASTQLDIVRGDQHERNH